MNMAYFIPVFGQVYLTGPPAVVNCLFYSWGMHSHGQCTSNMLLGGNMSTVNMPKLLILIEY